MLPAKLAIGFDSRSGPEARPSVRGSEMLLRALKRPELLTPRDWDKRKGKRQFSSYRPTPGVPLSQRA